MLKKIINFIIDIMFNWIFIIIIWLLIGIMVSLTISFVNWEWTLFLEIPSWYEFRLFVLLTFVFAFIFEVSLRFNNYE